MSEQLPDVSRENEQLIAEDREAHLAYDEAEVGARENAEYRDPDDDGENIAVELLIDADQRKSEARANVDTFYTEHKDELHDEALVEDNARETRL